METATRSVLQLEQRVPEGYSALAEEHRWHWADYVARVDATDLTAAEAFEHAAVLLSAARPRNDYEYQVVFITIETRRQVMK